MNSKPKSFCNIFFPAVFVFCFSTNVFAAGFTWPNTLYSDQFEMADLSSWNVLNAKWENGVTATLVNTPRVSGNQAFRINIPANAGITSTAGYIRRNFGMNKTDIEANPVYIRTYFRLSTDFDCNSNEFVSIMATHRYKSGEQGNGSHGEIWLVKRNNDFRFKIRGQSTLSSTIINKNEWYCIELKYIAGSGNGEIEFYVNGTSELHATNLNEPYIATGARIGAVYWNGPGVKGSLYFDDFIVDRNYIGPLGSSSITLIHPDLRSRTGAPVTAILTGDTPTDKIKATLTSTNGYNKTLFEQNSLSSGRINFKVMLADLEPSTYTLNVQLFDSAENEKTSSSYTFSREYSQDHFYTIDADNNIILNGNKFFPITSFGVAKSGISNWKEKNLINIAYSVAWHGAGLPYYQEYINEVQANGLTFIGPTHDTRFDGTGEPKWTRGDVEEYITAFKNHPANACWIWREEPENFGYNATSQKEWWDAGKIMDPKRPTEILFMAFQYFYNPLTLVGWDGTTTEGIRMQLKTYHWPYLTADIYSADWYPIEHPDRPYTLFSEAIDKAYVWNMNLTPVFPNIQPGDITLGQNGGKPTVAQLKNMCWLAIVHNAKGIHWYPYPLSAVPEENFTYMGEFVTDIANLTEAILGDKSSLNITHTTTNGVRVDTMVREYNGDTWLFAVAVDDDYTYTKSTNVTFHVNGLSAGTTIERYEESNLSSGSGTFTDTFEPLEVHIYKMSTGGGPAAPTGLKLKHR